MDIDIQRRKKRRTNVMYGKNGTLILISLLLSFPIKTYEIEDM